MKTLRCTRLLFLLLAGFLSSLSFQSCEPEDDDDENVTFHKPNIYIYPNEPIDLDVLIDFPLGGMIEASIPEYGSGWSISVDTSGLINDTYSFLFYESTQPDRCQRSYGWVVESDDLESFFINNLADYGFNQQEIADFLEYWLPLLNSYPYYAIYPQTNEIIDKMIHLSFSKPPENILRLFYVFIGYNQPLNQLTAPKINPFKREGYYVTEWGGALGE